MTDTLDARPGARGTTRPAGSFRVEEFRVPLMKAEIVGPKAAQTNPKSVDLDSAPALSRRRRAPPMRR